MVAVWRATPSQARLDDVLHPKPGARPRRRREPFPPGEVDHIFRRDGECVIAKGWRERLPGFVEPHRPCSKGVMGRDTVEHVKPVLGMGIRALNLRYFCVRACWEHNVNGECSRQREAVRAYLARVEPMPPGSIASPE